MIEHTREFGAEPRAAKAPPEAGPAARELARDYARVFLGTEAGRRVWADLRRKFGLARLCFTAREPGPPDALRAALVDGERRVMLEIQNALGAGAADAGLLEEFRKSFA